MSKKTQSPRTQKALHPGAPVPVSAKAKDSFHNFQARIGYGTGNVADGASYGVNYLSRNRYQLEAMYRSSWICGKAVDSVAEDMTKRGIEINSVMDPGEISSWRFGNG